MSGHRTPKEKSAYAEQARALRSSGVSRAQIKRRLGLGDDLLNELLRGTELPDTLRRPRAKDEHRAVAVALRAQGLSYAQIAAEVGVSKSSLSLWLRDLPRPGAPDPGVLKERTRRMWQARWAGTLAAEEVERARKRRQAAETLGRLTGRDLELVAVTAYWCEGAKDKAYSRRERVSFINSDAGLMALWLRYLREVGVGDERLRYSVSIHESADVHAALRFWARVAGVDVAVLGRPVLKRHHPQTRRKNIGEAYVGCLSVRVLQSRALYQHIAATWAAVVAALPDPPQLAAVADSPGRSQMTPSALV